jgi:hypothetical protein
MVLVAAAAAGVWGAVPFRGGIPIPIVARPELPFLLPLVLSIPPAAALTWAFIVIPIRTLQERVRRLIEQPGTALCIGVAGATLGVMTRWSLRLWLRPFRDGSPFIYSARLLYDSASWNALGIAAILPLLVLSGRFQRPTEWAEGVRLALVVYWVITFLLLSIL